MIFVPIVNANVPGIVHSLKVGVHDYEPRVQCTGAVAPSLLSSCQNIIDTMPADKRFTTWGPQDDPIAHMKLPLTYYSRKSSQLLPSHESIQQMTRLIINNIQKIECAN